MEGSFNIKERAAFNDPALSQILLGPQPFRESANLVLIGIGDQWGDLSATTVATSARYPPDGL